MILLANKLKFNSGKTEIILFGTNQELTLVDIGYLSFAGTKIIIRDSPSRNLGAMFDFSLPVIYHGNFNLRNSCRVRNTSQA